MRQTVEERIEALRVKHEAEMHEMEILGIVEEEIKELLGDIDDKIKSQFTEFREVGEEPEQATNGDGELLFSHPNSWRPKPLADFSGEERSKVTPYHKRIFANVDIAEDDMSDYRKTRLEGLKRVKTMLENLSY